MVIEFNICQEDGQPFDVQIQEVSKLLNSFLPNMKWNNEYSFETDKWNVSFSDEPIGLQVYFHNKSDSKEYSEFGNEAYTIARKVKSIMEDITGEKGELIEITIDLFNH